jgi:hypothetical protein
MWPSPCSPMPRLVQRFAYGLPPLRGMCQRFGGSLNALARRDALTSRASTMAALRSRQAGRLASMGDPDAYSFQCSARRRSAIQRENRRLRHGSSLFASERDFSRFNQGSVFCMSFVFAHNCVCASMKFVFCALQNGRFMGGHCFSVAFPELRLGPS